MIPRRKFLKGVSVGASGLVLAPLLQRIAAAADGTLTPPKRVIFCLFDNGFHEEGVQPEGMGVGTGAIRQIPLAGLKLPSDLEPFTPFRDRMTIVQGLRGEHLSPAHGAAAPDSHTTILSSATGGRHCAQAASTPSAIAMYQTTS